MHLPLPFRGQRSKLVAQAAAGYHVVLLPVTGDFHLVAKLLLGNKLIQAVPGYLVVLPPVT